MSAMRVQPVSTHLIEIRLRPEFSDAEGAEALARLRAEGLTALKDVRVSRLYEIKGAITATQVQQASRELLCDGVTQESRVVNPGTPPLNGMNFWRVEVWPKPTVADPPGETARDAIAEMGLPRPASVRCALVYRLLGRSSRPAIEKAVAKALANPLIHRCVVSEAHP